MLVGLDQRMQLYVCVCAHSANFLLHDSCCMQSSVHVNQLVIKRGISQRFVHSPDVLQVI